MTLLGLALLGAGAAAQAYDGAGQPCATCGVDARAGADYFTDSGLLRDVEPISAQYAARGESAAKRAFCARSEQDVLERFTRAPSFPAGAESWMLTSQGAAEAVDQMISEEGLKRPSRNLHEFDDYRFNHVDTLSFDNPGGTFDTGVCLADSRFQRAAAYLAVYRPDLPQPNPAQARALIGRIAGHDRVVEIPGFANLAAFSMAYKGLIVDQLNHDTLTGALDGDYATRVGDVGTMGPDALASKMRALYDRFLQRPEVIDLRIKPRVRNLGDVFFSHAWLLVDMAPIRDSRGYGVVGYTLRVIDSNHAHTIKPVVYRFGDTQVGATVTDDGHPIGGYNIYPDYDGDLSDIRKAIHSYCGT